MKNVASFIAIVLFSAIGYAQNGPKIEFAAQDNTIDYGKISKSDNAVRSFEFTNTGDAPLIITGAESTVSSIVVTKPATAILPGKKGKIDVKYNMAAGPIRKTITVETNAVNYPDGRVALKIKGEVL
jgi:multidrug efflux pump subunit AcrA (membrane-fusion protein)